MLRAYLHVTLVVSQLFCFVGFVEVMKDLGYPRLISLDSFRQPNFELVADCLYWLFQRYFKLVSNVHLGLRQM